VWSFLFTPDGKRLIARSRDQTVRQWDVATGKELAPFTTAPGSRDERSSSPDLALSPDGKLLAAGDGPGVRLWDVASGKELGTGAGHARAVTLLAAAADGKTVATAGPDGTVRRWEMATGKELSRVALPADALDTTLAPDGRCVVFRAGENVIHSWDTATGKPRPPIPVGAAMTLDKEPLVFSADCRHLAARGADAGKHRVARVWDVGTGKPLAVMRDADPADGFKSEIAAHYALTAGGETLAMVHILYPPPPTNGGPGSYVTIMIRLWDVATARRQRQFTAQAGIAGLAYSPDARTLATANTDATVSLWEIATGMERGRFRVESPGAAATALAFSADGRLLAVGGSDGVLHGANAITGHANGTALVWDSSDARRLATSEPAELTLERADEAWSALAELRAAAAHAAVLRLSAAPQRALPFLRERLKPSKEVGVERRVAGLIADLESPTFAVRQRATEELEHLGDRAADALANVLAGKPTLETRRRVERVLLSLKPNQPTPPPPAPLRQALRAVEVLERIGNPEARQILEKLAQGSTDAPLTGEARSALRRLGQR
jgi:WD40 repeat protein